MARLTAFLLCMLALTSALPCYGNDLRPPDIRRIKERGKLIVAQYGGVQPGFFAYDDCREYPGQLSCEHGGHRIVGCDIFLATELARQLGVGLELNRTARDYDTVCRIVASGKADVGISMLSVTLRRAQYLRFSSPYTMVRTGILVDRLYVSQAKNKNVLGLFDKSHIKIGVRGSCAYVDFVKEAFPKAQIVVFQDFEPMIRGVLNVEINAMYEDEFHIMDRLRRDPKLAVRLRFIPVPTIKVPTAIAVPPDSPNLLAFINLFLEMEHVRSETKRLLRLFVPSAVPHPGTAP